MAMSAQMLAAIKGAKNKFSRGGGKIYKLKEGKTTLRILPVPSTSPIAVDGQFWQECSVNWIKGTDGKVIAVVGNSKIVHDVDSPVETAIDLAIMSPSASDEDLKLFKDWKARTTVLVNALVRSGPDASDEPQAVELTRTTFGELTGLIEDYATDDGIDVLDLKTGYDFVIEKNGKGLDTRYNWIPKPTAKPVPKEAMEKAIDLFALVEKEFFRGEETKALTAIGSITGISTSHLKAGALPSARAQALLTRPTAIVPDAEVAAADEAAGELMALEEVVEEKPAAPALSKAAQARAALAAAEAEEAAEALAAETAAKAVALKAVTTKAVKAAAKPAAVAKVEEEYGATLDAADVDAVLGELDAI